MELRAAWLLPLLLLLLSQSGLAQEAAYAGSGACEGCHTYIFRNWQGTRHSSSVMTAAQAREAAYPLPVQRRGGAPLRVRSWGDVGHVIGRRKRLAYIDMDDKVLDSAYHQRMNLWGPFPVAALDSCGTCHFTGPGTRGGAGGEASLPGAEVERDIGCEACHGPGARHVTTLAREDIILDTSSRVCGKCHTSVGKVLPDDERQAMHEHVQVWHQDAHATGTRYNSYTTFCADCHAPSSASAETELANGPVFSEAKRGVSCIGCHNPHELTSDQYRQPRLHLGPALAPRLHTYRGSDRDFTTTDFREHDAIEEQCRQCHRGADRVELDHANASCADCHASYNRNRGPESRVVHDANRRGLSCQPCHRDADHLLTILYEDPEFLAPRHIHDLRKLPLAVRGKHGLNLLEASWQASPSAPVPGYGGAAPGQAETPEAMQVPEAGANLSRQTAQISGPLEKDMPMMTANPSPDNLVWLHRYFLAYLWLSQVDIEGVIEILEPAAWSAEVAVLRGMAELGRGNQASAIDLFTGALEAEPRQSSARFGLAQTLLDQGRFHQGRAELARVLEQEPGNALANYLLGRAYQRRGDAGRAADAFRAAVESDTASLEMWYQYARSLRALGEINSAISIHQEIVAREPTHFDSRFELASLLKLAGDASSYRLLAAREGRPPDWLGKPQWHARLEALAATSRSYAQLALSEFALAQRLRASDRRIAEQLADIYRLTGRLEMAGAQYQRLIALEPDHWLYHYRLGVVLLEQRQFTLAVDELAAALALAPAEGDVYFALGLALVRTGRVEEALGVLQRGTLFEPFNPGLYTNLGAAAGRLRQYALAEKALRRSLELASFPLPRVHLTHTNLALVHLALGRHEEAVTSLKRALHIFPAYQPASSLLDRLESGNTKGSQIVQDFVFSDLLSRFGEITTVAFADE